jgi:hypothetical protein
VDFDTANRFFNPNVRDGGDCHFRVAKVPSFESIESPAFAACEREELCDSEAILAVIMSTEPTCRHPQSSGFPS